MLFEWSVVAVLPSAILRSPPASAYRPMLMPSAVRASARDPIAMARPELFVSAPSPIATAVLLPAVVPVVPISTPFVWNRSLLSVTFRSPFRMLTPHPPCTVRSPVTFTSSSWPFRLPSVTSCGFGAFAFRPMAIAPSAVADDWTPRANAFGFAA